MRSQRRKQIRGQYIAFLRDHQQRRQVGKPLHPRRNPPFRCSKNPTSFCTLTERFTCSFGKRVILYQLLKELLHFSSLVWGKIPGFSANDLVSHPAMVSCFRRPVMLYYTTNLSLNCPQSSPNYVVWPLVDWIFSELQRIIIVL